MIMLAKVPYAYNKITGNIKNLLGSASYMKYNIHANTAFSHCTNYKTFFRKSEILSI